MLRQVLLSRKIAEATKMLDDLKPRFEGIEERKVALEQRESELIGALNEVTEETPEEDKVAIENEVTEHEAAKSEIEDAVSELEQEHTRLTEEIAKLQSELDEINERASKKPEERKEGTPNMDIITNRRMKFFRGMSTEHRSAIIAQDEVKNFLQRVRSMKGQTRAVNGAELNIPDVLLGVLRDNLHSYSKLVSKVRLVRVPGKSRQTIAGTIPEGVWTEACATLNELAISFSQIEVDGYKVGGFIPVCNALLEDSDVNLADEIMFMIGQAIGYALDKAILYGTGTKMPVGIVTRLKETSEPAYWNDNAYTWTDLHTTNIKKINPSGMTAEQLFAAIILDAGVAKANYSTDGAKFWAMNSTTFATLQAKALSFNAAGAIVSGQNMTMPIIGGEIVILEFIPDNDIIGGYGQLYLLAERSGAQFAVSEHVRFIDDQTVFKGTARYDGMPVFGEGFVAFNIANADVTTTMTFASDTANP